MLPGRRRFQEIQIALAEDVEQKELDWLRVPKSLATSPYPFILAPLCQNEPAFI